MSTTGKRIRAKVTVTRKSQSFIASAGDFELGSREDIRRIVISVLKIALEKTITAGLKWISERVPKRTGWLRETLSDTLETLSHVFQKGELKLVLGSNVRHAKYADRFDTSNVRHSGEVGYAYYHGHRGKLILDDPKAIGHYNSMMALFIRQQLRKFVREEIFLQVPQPYRKAFTTKLKVRNQ